MVGSVGGVDGVEERYQQVCSTIGLGKGSCGRSAMANKATVRMDEDRRRGLGCRSSSQRRVSGVETVWMALRRSPASFSLTGAHTHTLTQRGQRQRRKQKRR